MLRARMNTPSGFEVELCVHGPFIHKLKISIDLDEAPVTPPQTPAKSRQTSAFSPDAGNKYELTTPKDEAKGPRRPEMQLLLTPPESDNKSSHRISLPPNEPGSPLMGKSSKLQANKPTPLNLTVTEDISNPVVIPSLITLITQPRPPIISCQPSCDPFLDQPCMPQIPGSYPVSPPSKELQVNPTAPPTAPEPPAGTDSAARCRAITRAKKRCERSVKRDLALLCQAPEVPADLYCHQHIGIVLKPKGFYSHAEEDTWIEFAEWIPDYLQSATQAALRAEMEKYVSDSDEAGYVYAYEIRDPKPLNEFHIKVGRSVNIAERFNSWGKQCGSKETALRGWWPHGIKDGDAANSSSLLTGRINPGEKGKYCHRTERLIHLELRDIALNSTHLTPRFQAIALGERVNDSTSHSSSEPYSPLKPVKQSKRGKAPVQTGLPSKPCPDCKKMHREIFILQRATSGELKGREWELLVKPIIKKWGNFVTAHASKKA